MELNLFQRNMYSVLRGTLWHGNCVELQKYELAFSSDFNMPGILKKAFKLIEVDFNILWSVHHPLTLPNFLSQQCQNVATSYKVIFWFSLYFIAPTVSKEFFCKKFFPLFWPILMKLVNIGQNKRHNILSNVACCCDDETIIKYWL